MIETSCKGCVFSKIKDNKQQGCALGRLEKIQSETKTEEGLEYNVLSRFCNTYRPEEWTKKLSIKEQMNSNDTVLNEVRPRVGFLIYLDHSKDNPLTWLESTLMDIRDQTESRARYVIIVNEKVEYNQEIHKMLSVFFNKDDTFIHIMQMLEIPQNKVWLLDEAFRFALNGWMYVTTAGEKVDRDLLKNLHEHLNIKLKKLSIVLPYEGINGFLFQTALFKYLNGNKTKVWDDGSKDPRLFLDKAKDLDKTKDCILDWSQINVA